jgi:hypothetical protein
MRLWPGLIIAGLLCAGHVYGRSEANAVPGTSAGIAPAVRQQYCGERSFYRVKVRKDRQGAIGAYVLQPAIRDAPIPYLDHEGNALATFHIFGSDEEKRSATAVIQPLLTRFPIEEALDCAPGAS